MAGYKNWGSSWGGGYKSPIMVTMFGVGKSLVSPKRIPPAAIKEVHIYELNPNRK